MRLIKDWICSLVGDRRYLRLYYGKVRFLRLVNQLRGRDLWTRVEVHVPKQEHGSGVGSSWVLCPRGLNSGSVVYSFGVGFNVSSDLSLIDTFNLNVYAFDPTRRALAWIASQELAPNFHFLPYGLADYDGTATFNPPADYDNPSFSMIAGASVTRESQEAPVRRLATLMEMLGHKRIEALKMDIEGAEYGVIDDLKASGIAPRQLLIEFHHRKPLVGVQATRAAIAALHDMGYRIFHISASGHEYSFIHANSL